MGDPLRAQRAGLEAVVVGETGRNGNARGAHLDLVDGVAVIRNGRAIVELELDLKMIVQRQALGRGCRIEVDNLVPPEFGSIVEGEQRIPVPPIVVADKDAIFWMVLVGELSPPEVQLHLRLPA